MQAIDNLKTCYTDLEGVDTRRLEDCYPAIDCYEQLSIPFVVVLNQFDGGPVHSLEDVRSALNVVANTLILRFDARDKASVKAVLLSLLNTRSCATQDRRAELPEHDAASLFVK